MRRALQEHRATVASVGALSLTAGLIFTLGLTPAHAQDSNNASPTQTAAPSTPKKHRLTSDQRAALLAAQTTYKAAVQSALDGAHKAIADAQSIRDQAIAASPQDKNVRAIAINDFKVSSSQIWSVFRSAVAKAKATFDAAVTSIKGTASN